MSHSNNMMTRPRVLNPTLVEFLSDNYLLDQLKNPVDMDNKVTVINAPEDWFLSYFDETIVNRYLSDIKIPAIVHQKFEKSSSDHAFLYNSTKFNDEKTKKNKTKSFSVDEYKKLSKNFSIKTKTGLITEEMFNEFIESDNPTAVYAAEIDFSMFETYKGDKNWNLKKFKSCVRRIKDNNNQKVLGIHTPYVYIGSPGSALPCHLDDGNLSSINIHFYGADKIWFIINKKDGIRFHELTNEILTKSYPDSSCKNLMRHNKLFVTEKFLIDNKLHYTKVYQKPGTIVVTHPLAWHFGLDCGFNVIEAVAFASPRTIKYLCIADKCNCNTRIVLDASKVINKYYPTYNAVGAIRGNPDDPKVVEKKKQKQLDNLKLANNVLKEKNTKLSAGTINNWLNFYLNHNPYPNIAYPNQKMITKFNIWCRKEKIVLLEHEKCKYTQFRSRVIEQIFNPIKNRTETFDLSERDLNLIINKFKS